MTNILGITAEAYEESAGTTTLDAFTVLPSGAMKATIKEVIVYKNTYGNTQARVNILVDGGRELTFRRDVGATLKDGKANPGWTSLFKSLSYATGVDIADLKSEKDAKLKIFGQDTDGNFARGYEGIEVIALIRETHDTNKEVGEPYRETNDVEAICKADGSIFDKATGSKDGVAEFNDKCEKQNGIFISKSKKKSGSDTTAQPASDADATAAKSLI